MLSRLRGDGRFAFGEKIGSDGLMIASVLAVVLKILADIIGNIRDGQIRRMLLKKFVAENLPGVQGNGYDFIVSHLSLLAETFNKQALIVSQS